MVASRVRDIEMSGIRKMFEMAGKDAIMLGLGEPDFQPPKHVKEAFKRAIDEGYNNYGSTMGLLELREAIARRLRNWRDDVATKNVIVTASGTEALMSTFQSLFEKGDEILVPSPGFVLYEAHSKLAEAKPVHYSLHQENKFLPQQEELEKLLTPNTKGIVVNSPSNPTGGVFPEETVNMLADFAKDNNIILISDEVYDEIVYDRPHSSFLGKLDNHVYINSFSKSYAMTGWRLGYLAASSDLIKEISKMHYYTIACPPTPTQYAGLAALEGDQSQLKHMVAEFKKRRDVIVEEMKTIPGLDCEKPEGAIYAFPKFRFSMSSEAMAKELLQGGVLSTPGSAFGSLGEGHIRFSYANSLENIAKGMSRVRTVCERLEGLVGER